jgi:hypothetical protein
MHPDARFWPDDRRNVMKLFAIGLLAGAAARAADPTPLDLKTGEWEYTVTMHMSGMPEASAQPMPQIPPEALAKLPPDQRAKLEAAMKRASDVTSGKPTTSKSCVKKEDLAKLNPGGNVDKSCKMTVLSSSHSKQEIKMDCNSPDNKSTSTVTIEALSSESSKFSLVSSGTANGQPMNMTMNGTGKWLSATCTETK